MTLKSAQELFRRLKEDPELTKRLNRAKTKKAKLKIVRAEGFDFTEQEFFSARTELSDEDLRSLNVTPPAAMWGCGEDTGCTYEPICSNFDPNRCPTGDCNGDELPSPEDVEDRCSGGL